jgi:hypothetical protein
MWRNIIFRGLADKVEGNFPIDKPDMSFNRREPWGCGGCLCRGILVFRPHKTGPGSAAGNTVVIKAAEDGPPLLHFKADP